MDNNIFQLFQSAWNVAGIFGLTIIAAVITAYWAFKNFSTKWLDTKFAERLEQNKHNQQRELEGLKFRINGLVDRTVKIYSKEYAHIPELWFQINTAYRSVRALEAGIFVTPLNTMSEDQVRLFLDASEFTNLEKHDIINSSDKENSYCNNLRLNMFNKARSEHYSLLDSLSKYSIFLSEDLRESIDQFRELLWSAIVEYQVYALHQRRPGDIHKRMARDVLTEQGDEKLRVLERSIRDRLWNAEQVVL